MTLDTTIRLKNGIHMPTVGFGTYPMKGRDCIAAVRMALETGYRLIDTAQMYNNEEGVGEGIRTANVSREEVFLTTKLDNGSHGYGETLQACEESLNKLGLDYIDLYLIHWPVEGLREETWKAMVKLLEDGKCRSIGVSNYTERHLQELFDAFEVHPVVNQVEFHPFLYQRDLLSYCKEHGVVMEAYSPLAKGRRLDNDVVRKIAEAHGKEPAQVVLRWELQHGVVPIPKASSETHIQGNFDVFDFTLTDDQMAAIDCLHTGERCDWDPSGVK